MTLPVLVTPLEGVQCEQQLGDSTAIPSVAVSLK